MAKGTKLNPVISPLAAKKIATDERPVRLLVDLFALHIQPQLAEQVAGMFSQTEWDLMREAAEIDRFDVRREPRGELISLVNLYVDYNDYSGDLDTLVAKLKKMRLFQILTVLLQ